MKQSNKYILTVFVFAGLIAIASFGYRYLRNNYNPPDFTTVPAEDGSAQTTTTPSNKAEDFTVFDKNGNAVKLSDFLGKPVIINFWATWCSPCTSELPSFNKAYEIFGGKAAFLMVNLTDGRRETVQGVESFMADNGYIFPVYFDTSFSGSNAFNVSSIPFSVFIDSNGNIYKTHLGSMDEKMLFGYTEEIISII